MEGEHKYTDFVALRAVEEAKEVAARRNNHKEHLEFYKNQMIDARNRDAVHRSQQREQGELWRQEQMKHREEDRKKI